jgi:hypothetical protein
MTSTLPSQVSLPSGLAVAFALVCGCGGGGAPEGGGVQGNVFLSTGGSGASGNVEGSVAPGEMRIKQSVCNGMADLRPDYKAINEGALVAFLKVQGFETKTVRARADLVYVDVLNMGSSPIRLRVAILPTPPDAGRDLHEALLQHGPGSWGVHRSNLAVLAPIGSDDEIIALATKTKLACWGVLTVTGRDDTFVVPGGYTEL